MARREIVIDKIHIIIDRIFLMTNVPILFGGIDDKGTTYICAMYHSDQEKRQWIISECSPLMIARMLSDQITIKKAFMQCEAAHIIFTQYYNGTTSVNYYSDSEWKERSELPDTGAMMDADEGEFDEDIKYYRDLYWKQVEKVMDVLVNSITEITINEDMKEVKPGSKLDKRSYNDVSSQYNGQEIHINRELNNEDYMIGLGKKQDSLYLDAA